MNPTRHTSFRLDSQALATLTAYGALHDRSLNYLVNRAVLDLAARIEREASAGSHPGPGPGDPHPPPPSTRAFEEGKGGPTHASRTT